MVEPQRHGLVRSVGLDGRAAYHRRPTGFLLRKEGSCYGTNCTLKYLQVFIHFNNAQYFAR